MFGESVDAIQATLECFVLRGTIKPKTDATTSTLTFVQGTNGTLRTRRLSAGLSGLLRWARRLSCGRTGCLLAMLQLSRVDCNSLFPSLV